MQVNWKTLTMRFQLDDTMVTLQGDPSLYHSLISLKAMMKAIKGDGEAVLLELCSLVSSQQQQNVSPMLESIALLLQSYTDVFEEPRSLPLS